MRHAKASPGVSTYGVTAGSAATSKELVERMRLGVLSAQLAISGVRFSTIFRFMPVGADIRAVGAAPQRPARALPDPVAIITNENDRPFRCDRGYWLS